MRIAVIGGGNLGGTLAEAWARAGHDVTIGSRHPEQHAGGGIRVMGIEDAARGAAVVVNATPGSMSLDLLTAQTPGWLDGVVLLDVSNADDGAGNLTYPDGSLAERLQAAFPRARVVKSLNTFSRTVMIDPEILPEPTTVFVSGDDDRAKTVVVGLLTDLGWRAEQVLDLGPLSTARATEHMIALYYAVRDALDTRDFNLRVVSSGARAADL